MALSDLLPPAFKSGPSPDQQPLVLSPASVERRRRVAEAMMKQGMDYSPIQSPWQGVARVTNAIMGGLDERKADDIERAGLASQRDADASMYGGLLGGGAGGVPITGALGGATPPAGGTNGSPAPVAAVPLPSGDLAKHAYDYFTTKGYTPAAAAGLVGNMGAESGFAPDVLSGQRMGDKGTSGYLGQWHADRLTNYQNFAKAQGKSPSDYQTQLDFYNHELDTSEGRTKELLQGVNDPVKAAAIAAGFERPYGWKLGGDPSRIAGWDKRAGYAQHAFNQWGQAAPQVASADPDITGSVTPPAGPGASLSPQDMATLTARYGGGTPPAAAGITDAPVAINPPAAGASGPLSPAAANPVNPGAITDAPVPAGNPLAIPAPLPIPAIGANGLPEATNAGLRNQGIDPLQFMHGYEPTPATGSVPHPAAVPPVSPAGPVPMPPVDPRAAQPAPAAPPTPRAAVLAALQGPLKDSQVQMMIARGINPANPQAPVSPARQSILAALSGAAPAPPQAAQSPAAAQVTGALAAPATVPASSPQQPPPYPGQPTPQGAAPVQATGDAGGNPAQLAAAIKTMSNPWAPEGSREMAKTIIDRELQARDPLRRMQMLKLQQDMQGGTPDEIKQRQLAIQKTEQEINAPIAVGDTLVDRKTMKPVYQPTKKEFKELNGHLFAADPQAGTVTDATPNLQSGYRPATPEERKAYGVADGMPLFFGPDGKPSALGPQTSVNIQSGENAFEKASAEAQAKMFNTMAEDGIQAKTDLGNITNLRANLAKLPGGMLGGAQAIANSWGIKLGDNASSLEAANAILSHLIPAQRQGMPGAASDRDVQMFRDALPKMSNTPEGNAMILDTMQAIADQRAKQGQISAMVLSGQMKREDGIKAMQAMPDPFEAFRKSQGADAGAGAPPAALGGAPVAPPAALGAPPAAVTAPSPASPAAPTPPAKAPTLPGAVTGQDGTEWLPNPDKASAQTFVPILTDPSMIKRLKPGTRFSTPDGRMGVAK